jgi:hypothetical protein
MHKRTIVSGAAATIAAAASVAYFQHEAAIQPGSNPRARLAAQHEATPISLQSERSEAGVSIPQSTIEGMQLDSASVRLVGSFPGPATRPLRLYTARTTKGETCLIEDGIDGLTPDGRPLRVSGGACSEDLFLGRSVAWVRGMSRGAGGVVTPRIIGIVKPGIERLGVVSAGTRTDVPLTAAGAFVWFQPAGTARASKLIAETLDGTDVEETALP